MLALSCLEGLRECRRVHRFYDEELWDFFVQVHGNNLELATDVALQWRLEKVERNILFLDGPTTPRDDLKPERGWLSPWWWWRMRHWTLKEAERRGISPTPSPDIPPLPPLRPEFQGVIAGGDKLLVRISRRDRVLDTLNVGRLRFAPAASYNDATLNEARADEEMAKSYHRPGKRLTITNAKGEAMTALGEATFTVRRAIARGLNLMDTPYWFCSFSSDLDPRLFTEFADPSGAEDACLVVFDPMTLVRRLLPSVNRVAAQATKELFPAEYFDPHYPPVEHLSPVRYKHFSYGYQREMRLLVDPEGNPWSASGMNEAFFVEIGSIADIAGVYAPSGDRIAGTGPDNFLAR